MVWPHVSLHLKCQFLGVPDLVMISIKKHLLILALSHLGPPSYVAALLEVPVTLPYGHH